jgi:hypothetical protein
MIFQQLRKVSGLPERRRTPPIDMRLSGFSVHDSDQIAPQ